MKTKINLSLLLASFFIFIIMGAYMIGGPTLDQPKLNKNSIISTTIQKSDGGEIIQYNKEQYVRISEKDINRVTYPYHGLYSKTGVFSFLMVGIMFGLILGMCVYEIFSRQPVQNTSMPK